jgi:hypothetical protein
MKRRAFITLLGGICGWTSECPERSLGVIEPPSQSDRASNFTASQDPFERPFARTEACRGGDCVMIETALAFGFTKTRTICDAFDNAWAFLQGVGSDVMADKGLRDVTELRDDALAFLQHNPPPGDRNGHQMATSRSLRGKLRVAVDLHPRERKISEHL